jgi:hypothetical protein
MAETAELTPGIDYVEAEMNYIVDDGIPPVRYVDWPEEEHKAHRPAYEARRMRIQNGRTCGENFTLPTHGFEFLNQPSAMKDFFDEEEVERVYYPETEQLIKAKSGAKRVYVFDHTLRTADESRLAERWIRNPVHGVHNDYTERSAPQRVRDFLPDEADELLQHRFGIVQTWRPINQPVESEPLALIDGSTIPEIGFIPYQRRYKDRTGETYHISYSDQHRWYYFPLMTPDEVIVFKVFDTDRSAGVRFTAHSAFTDPTTRPDARFRESMEMRALVFY